MSDRHLDAHSTHAITQREVIPASEQKPNVGTWRQQLLLTNIANLTGYSGPSRAKYFDQVCERLHQYSSGHKLRIQYDAET